MHKSILAAMAALAVFAADRAVAEPVNPMRERVRQWETRMLENAVGKERAAELLTSKSNAEIVGGTVAPADKWPWQVALLWSGEPRNWYAQFCGGTLVHERFVVTAAHCVTAGNGRIYRGASIQVLTGTQSLNNNSGDRRAVEQIIRHPNYNDDTANFDIAVIKLRTPATGIKTARLISKAQETTLAAAGDWSYVTGWGDLGNGSFPSALHQVRVPIVGHQQCDAAYDGAITSTMICAGLVRGGKDSCQGDSGGPLVVADAQGRWEVLAGVVSWGEGCALPNFFGVYARVAVLRNWVVSTIVAMNAEAAVQHESTSCADLRGSSQAACLDGLSLAPK